MEVMVGGRLREGFGREVMLRRRICWAQCEEKLINDLVGMMEPFSMKGELMDSSLGKELLAGIKELKRGRKNGTVIRPRFSYLTWKPKQ